MHKQTKQAYGSTNRRFEILAKQLLPVRCAAEFAANSDTDDTSYLDLAPDSSEAFISIIVRNVQPISVQRSSRISVNRPETSEDYVRKALEMIEILKQNLPEDNVDLAIHAILTLRDRFTQRRLWKIIQSTSFHARFSWMTESHDNSKSNRQIVYAGANGNHQDVVTMQSSMHIT
eukprot:IDg12433t1